MLDRVMRAFFERPGAVFGAILAWKLLLLVFAQLPPPSNDSFFYDAAAVNLASHGKFAAPSLGLALPISANETFSAYPPLYPLTMAAWMKLCGTSALSSMWLHWLLFAAAAGLVFATGRKLGLPAATISLGGLFLLCISFHDRPDSLANVFGLGAVFFLTCWLCHRGKASGFAWGAAAGVVLTLGTGLQIGALFMTVTWLGFLLGRLASERRLPYLAMAASLAIPALLIAGVIQFCPRLWAGFLEHAHQTPSVTGWRLPRVDELLKLARTLPGTLAACVIWLWLRPIRLRLPEKDASGNGRTGALLTGSTTTLLFTAVLLPSAMLAAASMMFFTPNGVSFAAYLQPVVVATALAIAMEKASARVTSALLAGCVLLAGVGAIRMFGLTTWGVALARDCGYHASVQIVRQQISAVPPGGLVVGSAAYLYEMSAHDIRAVHCDWLGPAGPNQETVDWEGLVTQRPRLILLTQFDYYRRYEPLLRRLQSQTGLATVSLQDHARLKPPDAIRPLRRVVQHLSWAPMVVRIDWTGQ